MKPRSTLREDRLFADDLRALLDRRITSLLLDEPPEGIDVVGEIRRLQRARDALGPVEPVQSLPPLRSGRGGLCGEEAPVAPRAGPFDEWLPAEDPPEAAAKCNNLAVRNPA